MGRQKKGSRAFLWVRLEDLAFKNNRPVSAEIFTDVHSENLRYLRQKALLNTLLLSDEVCPYLVSVNMPPLRHQKVKMLRCGCGPCYRGFRDINERLGCSTKPVCGTSKSLISALPVTCSCTTSDISRL